MALGFVQSSSGGEFKQIIKYDARAGRMFRIDRMQTADGFKSNPIEITQNAVFIADMANIRVGWIFYSPQGPLKALVTYGKAPRPPRPDGLDDKGKPAYKQAFELDIMLHKDSGGGDPREFSSGADCVRSSMDEMHDIFLAAPESKKDKLPVLKLTGSVQATSGASTNYKPIFEIVAWVDRPTALAVQNGTTATYAVGPTPTTDSYAVVKGVTPPATGSTQVAPPPAHTPVFQGQPQPVFQGQPEPVGSGDFG